MATILFLRLFIFVYNSNAKIIPIVLMCQSDIICLTYFNRIVSKELRFELFHKYINLRDGSEIL
jgi:hypothetical protein